MKEPRWLTIASVIAAHKKILAMSGGSPGILNQGAVESTLHKAQNLFYYSERQVTIFELAAAYGYGFAKNHCFVDGNKRIALIAVYTFLAINGVELTASEVDTVQYFLGLAASQEPQEIEMDKLANWLQSNSSY